MHFGVILPPAFCAVYMYIQLSAGQEFMTRNLTSGSDMKTATGTCKKPNKRGHTSSAGNNSTVEGVQRRIDVAPDVGGLVESVGGALDGLVNALIGAESTTSTSSVSKSRPATSTTVLTTSIITVTSATTVVAPEPPPATTNVSPGPAPQPPSLTVPFTVVPPEAVPPPPAENPPQTATGSPTPGETVLPATTQLSSSLVLGNLGYFSSFSFRKRLLIVVSSFGSGGAELSRAPFLFIFNRLLCRSKRSRRSRNGALASRRTPRTGPRFPQQAWVQHWGHRSAERWSPRPSPQNRGFLASVINSLKDPRRKTCPHA
ncbi:hypothetical protein PG999_013231 [Apiospora kogelbergensis]|uniref:Uncharacterized protein n=1 Tax=Apiospora kogelbergensis TaxID=1337665 RepID=A0AAW0QAH9_9PEZI